MRADLGQSRIEIPAAAPYATDVGVEFEHPGEAEVAAMPTGWIEISRVNQMSVQLVERFVAVAL